MGTTGKLSTDMWICSNCGKFNSGIVTICACGYEKDNNKVYVSEYVYKSGWICPLCGRIYSPYIPTCNCNYPTCNCKIP